MVLLLLPGRNKAPVASEALKKVEEAYHAISNSDQPHQFNFEMSFEIGEADGGSAGHPKTSPTSRTNI